MSLYLSVILGDPLDVNGVHENVRPFGLLVDWGYLEILFFVSVELKNVSATSSGTPRGVRVSNHGRRYYDYLRR